MTKAIIPSPIGAIVITGDGKQLLSIDIAASDLPAEAAPPGSIEAEAAAQITAYLSGGLRDFDLPLAPLASPRGQALRAAMIGIGFGETLSYGALARLAGSSARAIGQACSRNPFPIVVPCHRILARDGLLGHYSAGDGLATKAWLLDHENGGRLL